jgi:hypothetical protein
MKMKSFRANIAGVVIALILLGCTLTQLRNPTLTPISGPTSESPANATLLPPTANRSPVLTGIQSPADGSSFSSNGTIPVNVSIDSQKPAQLVQVYLDGQAIDSTVPEPQAQIVNLQIPGVALQGEGLHTLMVMTFDSDGRVALSNVVHLYGIPAEPVAYKLTAKKGDTLQAFAEGIQVNLDDLLAANPELVKMGITSGPQTLPEDTTLIVNLGIPPASQLFTVKAPGQVKYAAGIPTPPSATIQVGGCDVQVIVSGQDDQSSGYILYRLDPDSARFVAVKNVLPGGDGSAVFADKALQGPTQYLVSAYNDNGETFSIPVVAKPTDPGCSPVKAGLPVSNGILALPQDVKSVYFYIAINSGEYDRWPAKQGEFLSPSNGTIDLLSLLKTRPDLKLTYPLYINLEVWGWKGGNLLFLGNAYANLDETDLMICQIGPDCSGEASVNYVYNTSISDEKNASRAMKWYTSLPEINTVLFQLSTSPFPNGYQTEPPGLVYSQLKSGSGGSGHFVVDYANLPLPSQMNIPGDYGVPVQPTGTAQQTPTGFTGLEWLTSHLEKVGQSQWQLLDLNSTFMTPGSLLPVERRYFARFIPMDGGQPIGPVSNTVVIDFKPGATQPPIVIESIPPIYDIHIEQDQFIPPIPPDASIGWGCVDVLAVDPNAMAWTDPEGPWQYAYGIWLHAFETKTPICPTVWDPDANQSPLEKLWDYVNDGIGYINQAFHYAKDAVIGPFEAGLQLLSLGNCGTYCHQWLHVGLDIALAAYGIPPEIPDLNKLTDQGIDYIVDEGLKQIQLDGACSVVPKCREELTKMLKTMKNQFNNQITNTYQNEATAHAHGVNPLAIPYGGAVTVQPAAAAKWQMPAALVTITRKPGTENVTDIDMMYKFKYWMDVWINAYNETCVGQEHSYSTASCTINGGVAYGCNDVVETLNDPCEGTLFWGRIRVPTNLQPGESRQVKVILMPQPYYLPVPLPYQVYQSISSNDFPYLYVGADTTIQATLFGSVQSGAWPLENSVAADGPYPLTLPADLEFVH